MKSTSYKIRIRATVNGVEKTPSHIAWVNGSDECLVRKCYKEKDYIVIELIPDCVGDSCIEGWVHFDNVCTDCDPIHFKRCFCSLDSDCGDCEECILGVCQSACPVDFVCKNDKCIQCDDTIKCPDGQVCKDGVCVCAPGTFYSNEYKRCVECDSSTIFTDKCKSCVNGHILHVDCYGACDPATGQCVDCIKNGDCDSNTDGRYCCENKVCKCCAGTVWNPTLGKCVEDCKDAGCPTCERCGPTGCEPIKCPTGFKCVEGECVEWPCKDTTCNNGGDCGKDCGCLNGQCVPCKILNCATGQCASVLGCECASNGVCQGSDKCDTTYCDGFSPCLQDGCTCYEYNCVDCNNFSCTTGECAAQLGCKCSNGKCVDDPDGGSGGGDGCSDSFTLSADCGAECKLKATLNSGPCKCDPIKFEVKPTVVSGNTFFPGGYTSVSVEMYKGTAKYADYKTAETIGSNETVTGEVKVFVTYTKPGAKTEQITLTAQIKDNIVQPVLIPDKPGYTMTFSVQNKGIKISNNSCTDYDDEQIATYSAADILAGVTKENMSKDSTSNRRPLFTWYKNGVLIKKDFPKGSAGSYEDFIDDPKLATLGDDFVVKAECGCSTTTSLSNLEFCCSNVDVPITACGTKAALPKIQLCDLVKKQAKAIIAFTQSDGTVVTRELSDAASEFTSAKDTNIESAEVYLEVNGKKLCKKSLPIPAKVAPTPIFTPTCGDKSSNSATMKIAAPSGSIISSITFTPSGIIDNITNQSIASKEFKDVDKNALATAGGLEATVTYSNGCIAKVKIEPCPFEVETNSRPSIPNCDNLGKSGNLFITPVGFDTTKPIKYTVLKNNFIVNTFTQTLGNNIETTIPYEGEGTYTIWIEQGDKKAIDIITIAAPTNIAFPEINIVGGNCLDDAKSISVILGLGFKNVPVVASYTNNNTGAQEDLMGTTNEQGTIVFGVVDSGKFKVTSVKDSSVVLCGNEEITITKDGKKLSPVASIPETCTNVEVPVTLSGVTNDDVIITPIGGEYNANNKTFKAYPGNFNYGLQFSIKNPCDTFVIVPGYSWSPQPFTISFNTKVKQPVAYGNLITSCVGGQPTVTLTSSSNATVKLIQSNGVTRDFTRNGTTFTLANVSLGEHTVNIEESGKCINTTKVIVSSCPPIEGSSFNIYTEDICVSDASSQLMMGYATINTLPATSGTIEWLVRSCSNGNLLNSYGPFTFNVISGATANLQKSFTTSAYNPVCVSARISYGDNIQSNSNLIQLQPTLLGDLVLGATCDPYGSTCQCANYETCIQLIDGRWTCGGVEVIDDCTLRDPNTVQFGDYCNDSCHCGPGQVCHNQTCKRACGCGFDAGIGGDCVTGGQSTDCAENESCTCPGGITPCECTPDND